MDCPDLRQSLLVYQRELQVTKHMFISKKNYWFSKAAFLMTFFQFGILLLDTYWQMIHPSGVDIVKLQTLFQYIVDGSIILFTIATFQLPKKIAIKAFFIGVLLCIFATLKILMSHFTISAELQSILTLANFLLNVILVSLLWWLSRLTNLKAFHYSYNEYPKIKIFTWIGFFLIFLEIGLSVWIRALGAEHLCADFPWCNGEWLAHFDLQNFMLPWNTAALMTFNMLYRLGLMIISFYMLILGISLVRSQFAEIGLLLLVLLATQFTLAMMNMRETILWIAMSFDVAMTMIVMLMISLLLTLYRKPEDNW
jgi:cytochrome c oxidase assembly protein subunit 15